MKSKIYFLINRYYSRNFIRLLSAVVLLLPLFFIGTHTSHDWGDDFAQYIHQAANIIKGIPQSETGFVYNGLNYIGPAAYPIGFPLLLAPVYAVAGNNIEAFISMVSIFYITLGVFVLLFYRRFFKWSTALFLMLILAYNPQLIIFKREVMSDIPFTLLLVINFYLYFKTRIPDMKYFVLMALITGIMLTIRPVGIVFVMAVILEQVILFFRKQLKGSTLWHYLLFIGIIPLAYYFLVNSLIFRVPSGGGVNDYLNFYRSGNFWAIIPENFAHHIEVFRYMYEPESGVFKGFSLLTGAFILAMSVMGFTVRILRVPDALDWFFIFYLLLLLVFPNSDSAFRMLVPLGFILLFYAAIGLRTVKKIPTIPLKTRATLAGLGMMLLFSPGIAKITETGNHRLNGPQQVTSEEAFDFIRKNINPQDVVVFVKPRALALYAGVKSMSDPFTADPTAIHKQLIEFNARYILVHKKLTKENTMRYVRMMKHRISKIWENDDFTLYRINLNHP